MRKRNQIWRTLFSHRWWLAVGIGIKRWLLLLGIGSAIAGMGLVYLILVLYRLQWISHWVYDLATLQFLPIWLRVLAPALLGVVLIFVAVVFIGRNLVAPFRPTDRPMAESLYEHSKRGRGPHIVAIGGGTGMPNLLRGLREYTHNITAVVTVADDGGSSGRLRRELGLLPPGDFRNNIAALSRDEALMTQVLQYRFGSQIGAEGEGNGRSELQGHAFGNLLLAALTGITGSFNEALLAAERVLAVRGRVLPSTLETITLVADVAVDSEGAELRRVVGESAIPKAGGRVQRVSLEPPHVRAYPPVVQAIFQADLIVLGPGSLYTSILPNLLVSDLAHALQRSRAPKVYVCNLAMQPGETDNYTVADHVDTILRHTPANILDFVLANNNLEIPPDTGGGQTQYVQPVAPDNVYMVTADLVDKAKPWRHDSAKLAKVVMNLLPGRG